jgi:outer membrane receptor protein involved in Fe transport
LTATFPTIYFPQSQTASSLYLEGTLPLITSVNALPGAQLLELQLADRFEHYSVLTGTTSESIDNSYIPPNISYNPTPPDANSQGFGGTPSRTETAYNSNNETFGLKWKPIDDVIARGSVATAFLPPSYSQLLPNPVVCPDCAFITDPKSGQSYAVNTIGGGNPALLPQTSRSIDIGMIYQPMTGPVKGLRVDLEHYQIWQFNVITTPSGNQVLSSPAFADRVTRNSEGIITLLNLSDINAPEFKTEGYDLSINYQTLTHIGTFQMRAMGTMIQSEDRQICINCVTGDYVGWPDEGGEGKYKANGTLSWANHGWAIGWTTTWFSDYHVNGTPGDPLATFQETLNTGPGSIAAEQGSWHIPSQIYHRVVVSYSSGKDRSDAHGILADTTVQLVVDNIFNTWPPFDAANAPFYYSPYGNIQLRTIQLSLKKSF